MRNTFEDIKILEIITHIAVAVLLSLSLSGCYSWYHVKSISDMVVSKHLANPSMKAIKVAAAKIKHPVLKPVFFDLGDGVSPDEAAILAVVSNPALKVKRTKLGIAKAQLTQAGILPNPIFSYTFDSPIGGTTLGSFNAWGFGLSWDIRSLVSIWPKIKSKRENRDSIELDVAWREFQVAQSARIAVFRAVTLRRQLETLGVWQDELKEKIKLVANAIDKGVATLLDLSSTKNTYNDVEAAYLAKKKEVAIQFLSLKRILGLSPDYPLTLEADIRLPNEFNPAPLKSYMKEITKRRLDILAMRHGYESQEEAVMVAILEQIPRVNIGLNHARDSGNLYTLGLGVSVDVPIFDRNQGHIAIERAVREKLYKEYMFRLYTARADIARIVTMIQNDDKQIAQLAATIPEQETLLKNYRNALRQGQGEVLVYFHVANRLTLKRIRLEELRYQLAADKIRLAIASGYYNPGGR
ncbi:MAG: TolC family protein [Kiritimatiellaeota bacterium]|nr:TolC family protein [Kiritimatiellota bacterium]